MNNKKIGFIGGGNMASSLLNGLIASGHAEDKLWVSDTNPDVLNHLSTKFNIHLCENNSQLAEAVDVVVLAVKPQIMHAVADSLASAMTDRPLIISIAAGINQASLAKWLGSELAIVRCMPNTPALVRMGATALHANSVVDNDERNLAETILRAVGVTLWVDDESQLDAVTAVSGSGPAYFFLLMEAMEEIAIELGLPAETARLLIQQTALGAATIALESEEPPGILRQRVTSPGGTTEKAIQTFQQGDFNTLVSQALTAAKRRSVELSKELGAL